MCWVALAADSNSRRALSMCASVLRVFRTAPSAAHGNMKVQGCAVIVLLGYPGSCARLLLTRSYRLQLYRACRSFDEHDTSTISTGQVHRFSSRSVISKIGGALIAR